MKEAKGGEDVGEINIGMVVNLCEDGIDDEFVLV
jgi:hypothetical protein